MNRSYKGVVVWWRIPFVVDIEHSHPPSQYQTTPKRKSSQIILWFHPLPFSHQTWRAGKSPTNGDFNRKITYKWSIFQHAMFEYRRIHPPWFLVLTESLPQLPHPVCRLQNTWGETLWNGGGLISPGRPKNQWPFQEPIDWRYLPYIRPIVQAYLRGYLHKIWPNKWYERTNPSVGSWNSHWIHG